MDQLVEEGRVYANENIRQEAKEIAEEFCRWKMKG